MQFQKIQNFVSLSLVMLLVGCAATGYRVPTFLPAPADGKVDFPDDNCLRNPLKTELQRDVNGMRFTISLDTYAPSPHAVQQYPRNLTVRIDPVDLPQDRPQQVRVDASRISLNEGGRLGKQSAYNRDVKQVDDLNATHLWTRIDFDPVVDFPSTAKLVFAPGAIKLNGRNIPFDPINYDIVIHEERWSNSLTCGT